jgi:nucleoside phosphorylase
MSPNDWNNYTFGKIGKHNVVIGSLPAEYYGVKSAGSTAEDMLYIFPNITIVLMVGIGGGLPTRRHDIRLGDVVVSAARNGMGGVFQYDWGRMTLGQSFPTTRYLNHQTRVLQAAVSKLKAQLEREGHRLGNTINNVLEKKPRLLKRYARPNSNTDRLYKSGFVYTIAARITLSDAQPELIPRSERSDDNPAIHYGLIASTNLVMKNALIRDTIAIEKDILCFDMGVAGLMNNFPCLVIRGTKPGTGKDMQPWQRLHMQGTS